MTQRAFNATAGVVFLAVAALHALRVFQGWHVSVGEWIVPMWVSWAGLALAGFLAYTAFRLKK